jgi:hypothetical protein
MASSARARSIAAYDEPGMSPGTSTACGFSSGAGNFGDEDLEDMTHHELEKQPTGRHPAPPALRVRQGIDAPLAEQLHAPQRTASRERSNRCYSDAQ